MNLNIVLHQLESVFCVLFVMACQHLLTVEDSKVLWQIVIPAFHVQLCQQRERDTGEERNAFFLFKLVINNNLDPIKTIKHFCSYGELHVLP